MINISSRNFSISGHHDPINPEAKLRYETQSLTQSLKVESAIAI